MHPIICRIGPFTVYSYGLMLAIAFAIAVFLVRREGQRQGVDPDQLFNFCFIVFVSGVLGARLLYVLGHLPYYLERPLETVFLQQGGLSWFGGLTAGIISGFAYLKAKRLPVLQTVDLVIPYVALGQALGRVGCLLNGCCYGKHSAWGLYFPVHEDTLIPTQLYSALILLFIFAVLRLLRTRLRFPGDLFAAYLVLYSMKRFFIEFWRADNPVVFAGLTLFQLFSIGFFIAGLAMLVGRRIPFRAPQR